MTNQLPKVVSMSPRYIVVDSPVGLVNRLVEHIEAVTK